MGYWTTLEGSSGTGSQELDWPESDGQGLGKCQRPSHRGQTVCFMFKFITRKYSIF